MAKIINQLPGLEPFVFTYVPAVRCLGSGAAGYVYENLTIRLPDTTTPSQIQDLVGKYIVNERTNEFAKITWAYPARVSGRVFMNMGPVMLNRDPYLSPLFADDFPDGAKILASNGGNEDVFTVAASGYTDALHVTMVESGDLDYRAAYTCAKADIVIDRKIKNANIRYEGIEGITGNDFIYIPGFNEGDLIVGETIIVYDGINNYEYTVSGTSWEFVLIEETLASTFTVGASLWTKSPFKWKIVDAPVSHRLIDYKVKADIKNFFYFPRSNEWVVYHTLSGESYYGGRFFPWVGAITCYDENDSQIYPSDIIFYPEIISNGIYESAKAVIRWTGGAQEGKVCFNEGFSQREDGDQSRLILNVVAGDFAYNANNNTYGIVLAPKYSARASAVVTTEPFMTVDGLANGKTCSCAFVYYIDPDGSEKFPYMSRVRIRGDVQMFRAIDDAVAAPATNPDILYTVTLHAESVEELMLNTSWFSSIQNSMFRVPGTDRFYYINVADLPPDSVDTKWGVTRLYIDNIGYYYDELSATPFNFVLYCHGKLNSPLVAEEWVPAGSITTIAAFTAADKVSVAEGEAWRPMLKIDLAGGFAKIIKRNLEFTDKILGTGEIEREYSIEIPCATSMHDRIRLVDFKFVSDIVESDYINKQIMIPVSYIKEGAIAEEASARVRVTGSKLFTKTVFAVSDYDIDQQTYSNASGGGIYDPSSPNRGDVLNYPKSSTFREVTPNAIASTSDDAIELEVLSGSSGDHESVAPDFEAKLFILYDNRKWRFNKSEYESFNCGQYPAWVFEINATALLQEFDVITLPSLPDMKRWFRGYCRGFGLACDPSTRARISSTSSGSELVMEIWDLKSSVVVDGEVVEKPNWRSLTPSQYDDPAADAGFISEQRTFRFGGEKVASGVKIKSFLDLKTTATDAETGTEYTAAQRYIDSDNKIRFRARIQPRVNTNIVKGSTDRDLLYGDTNPWPAGAEVVPVSRLEDVAIVGMDYFKTESL